MVRRALSFHIGKRFRRSLGLRGSLLLGALLGLAGGRGDVAALEVHVVVAVAHDELVALQLGLEPSKVKDTVVASLASQVPCISLPSTFSTQEPSSLNCM